MLLLVDIGNTSLKIGMYKEGSPLISYTLPTEFTNQSADSLGLQLQALCNHAELAEKVQACMVSSVVPGMDPLLRKACKRYLCIEPCFAHQDAPVPLENHYERPQEVGADRLVAAYGARRFHPEAEGIICVDYGTATTFDCISGQAYLGGLICPGVMSSLGALATRTAQLPRIALETCAVYPVAGRNTITSLNHGFLFGFASMTEGLCERLAQSLPENCINVATGGFARAVSRVTMSITMTYPDLVLEGLRFMYQDRA